MNNVTGTWLNKLLGGLGYVFGLNPPRGATFSEKGGQGSYNVSLSSYIDGYISPAGQRRATQVFLAGQNTSAINQMNIVGPLFAFGFESRERVGALFREEIMLGQTQKGRAGGLDISSSRRFSGSKSSEITKNRSCMAAWAFVWGLALGMRGIFITTMMLKQGREPNPCILGHISLWEGIQYMWSFSWYQVHEIDCDQTKESSFWQAKNVWQARAQALH